MSDLISREKAIRKIKKLAAGQANRLNINCIEVNAGEVIDCLYEEPTACDINSIVEALEKFREEMRQFGCDGMLSDMLEVVKQGGISNTSEPDNLHKAIAELENIKGRACVGIRCETCPYTQTCLEGEKAQNVAIDKAIEIVKAIFG